MAVLHDAFNSIDMDMSGAISTSELADLLKSMGTRATIEELEDMVCTGGEREGKGGRGPPTCLGPTSSLWQYGARSAAGQIE